MYPYQGEHLSKLQDTSLSDEAELDCLASLQEIANEQHFEVTFVDVEEISKRGLYQCMVQLSTVPVAVCFGEGLDRYWAVSYTHLTLPTILRV